jgi:hypothetical protein
MESGLGGGCESARMTFLGRLLFSGSDATVEGTSSHADPDALYFCASCLIACWHFQHAARALHAIHGCFSAGDQVARNLTSPLSQALPAR